MGSNITPEKLTKWLSKNHWIHERTKKHEIWNLKIIDEDTGEVILYAVVTINTHRKKGQGVSEDALKSIAEEMKIEKQTLVEMIKNKENYDYKKILKKYS